MCLIQKVLRLVQSIPSKNAESFKIWLGRPVVTGINASDKELLEIGEANEKEE